MWLNTKKTDLGEVITMDTKNAVQTTAEVSAWPERRRSAAEENITSVWGDVDTVAFHRYDT